MNEKEKLIDIMSKIKIGSKTSLGVITRIEPCNRDAHPACRICKGRISINNGKVACRVGGYACHLNLIEEFISEEEFKV